MFAFVCFFYSFLTLILNTIRLWCWRKLMGTVRDFVVLKWWHLTIFAIPEKVSLFPDCHNKYMFTHIAGNVYLWKVCKFSWRHLWKVFEWNLHFKFNIAHKATFLTQSADDQKSSPIQMVDIKLVAYTSIFLFLIYKYGLCSIKLC